MSARTARTVRWLNVAAIFVAGFVAATLLFFAVGLVGADDTRRGPAPTTTTTTQTPMV